MSIESVILYNLLYLLWEFRGPSVLLQIELFHSFLWLSSIGRRQWQPTPVLLPGKSHGWRSLVGCSPWGRWESDTTERLHFVFLLPCIGEGNGNPLQCSCLENPRDGGAWWAAVYGVAQSRTRLKWLSSSSSSIPLHIWLSSTSLYICIYVYTHTHTHTHQRSSCIIFAGFFLSMSSNLASSKIQAYTSSTFPPQASYAILWLYLMSISW